MWVADGGVWQVTTAALRPGVRYALRDVDQTLGTLISVRSQLGETTLPAPIESGSTPPGPSTAPLLPPPPVVTSTATAVDPGSSLITATMGALEAAPDHPRHADAVASLVSELIEAGMDYYFLRPLKLAEVGFVTEQSARLGMSGAVKVISSVSTKIILRMDGNQLLVVASYIRALA